MKRPVTAAFAGIRSDGSVSAATGGRGRPPPWMGPPSVSVVSSASYGTHAAAHQVVGFLANKEAAIVKELERLGSENETMMEDAGDVQALRDVRDGLREELADLEDSLCDRNMCLDKIRSHADPTKIAEFNRDQAMANEALAEEIDGIYLQNQTKLRDIDQLEKGLDDLHINLEARIVSKAPDKLQRFHSLIQQRSNLLAEGRRREEETGELVKNIAVAENANGAHEEIKALKEAVSALKAKLSRLDSYLKLSAMPLDSARRTLRLEVDAKGDRVGAIEKEMDGLDEEVDRLLTQRDCLLSEISGIELLEDDVSPGDLDQVHTETKLIESEKEDIREQISVLRRRLDDEVRKGQEQLPSRSDFCEVQEDALFHHKQLGASQGTLDRLRGMEVKRAKELEEINCLEDKIEEELQSLESKIALVQKDMNTFDDLIGLQTRSELLKEYLVYEKTRLQQTIKKTSKEMQEIAEATAQSKAEIEGNKNSTLLTQMKQESKELHHAVCALNTFVRVRGDVCDYSDVKENCLAIVRHLGNARSGADPDLASQY